MRTSMCGRPSGSETTGLTSGRMKARKKKKQSGKILNIHAAASKETNSGDSVERTLTDTNLSLRHHLPT